MICIIALQTSKARYGVSALLVNIELSPNDKLKLRQMGLWQPHKEPHLVILIIRQISNRSDWQTMKQKSYNCEASTNIQTVVANELQDACLPLSSPLRGSHQISPAQYGCFNFPLWPIILLDTKPQEPEAECQYSVFTSWFTPPNSTSKSQFSRNSVTHYWALEHPVIWRMKSTHIV